MFSYSFTRSVPPVRRRGYFDTLQVVRFIHSFNSFIHSFVHSFTPSFLPVLVADVGASQIRTILVSPKDARVLSMTGGGGVPLLAAPRRGVVSSGVPWQPTADDILNTLSVAAGE